MTQRILLVAAATILLIGTTSFGQEKKESPASPSDIPVDQIKKETTKATKTQEPDAKTRLEENDDDRASPGQPLGNQPIVCQRCRELLERQQLLACCDEPQERQGETDDEWDDGVHGNRSLYGSLRVSRPSAGTFSRVS